MSCPSVARAGYITALFGLCAIAFAITYLCTDLLKHVTVISVGSNLPIESSGVRQSLPPSSSLQTPTSVSILGLADDAGLTERPPSPREVSCAPRTIILAFWSDIRG